MVVNLYCMKCFSDLFITWLDADGKQIYVPSLPNNKKEWQYVRDKAKKMKYKCFRCGKEKVIDFKDAPFLIKLE